MRTGFMIRLGALLLAPIVPAVWGAEEVKSQECWLVWDAVADARVVRYRLYVSRQAGAYPFGKPAAEVAAPTTAVSCTRLPLSRRGQYYAVVTAVDRAGRESPPSNEVSFVWNPPRRPHLRKEQPR